MSDEFPNVLLDGRPGSLTLTNTDITFAEKTGFRVSKSEWPLEAVKEDVVKPVTSSVVLTLEMGDFKDCLSFKMKSLAEVVRFRKRLEERLNNCKPREDSQQQEEDTPESLPPIPEKPKSKLPERDVVSEPWASEPPTASINAASSSSKPAKSADASLHETDATMSMSDRMNSSERTMSMSDRMNSSERSRPGAVLVVGASQDRGATKARRHHLASSLTASLQHPNKPIEPSEPCMPKTELAPAISSSSDETDDVPVRDVISDENSLDDVSEFADDLPDHSEHQNSISSLNRSMNMSSQNYGRRRNTVTATAPLADMAKDLLKPTDHEKSLNESVNMSASQNSRGHRREMDRMNSSVRSTTSSRRSSLERAKMNASTRSNASSQRRTSAMLRGLRNSASSVRGSGLRDSVSSNAEPPALSSDRRSSKLSASTSSKSDTFSSRRMSRSSRRTSQKMNDSSKKSNSMDASSPENNNSPEPETPQVGAFNYRHHAISEKSAEWKSGDINEFKSKELEMSGHISTKSMEEKSGHFSLQSAEEGNIVVPPATPPATGPNPADPYNIGLVEARVVDGSDEFVRPSAVASAVDLEEEEMQRQRMLYRFGAFCCLVVVAVVILAVLAGTGVLGGGSTETILATVKLTPEERFALIEEHISSVVYDPTTLENLNTPQRMALNWLAKEDKVYKDIMEVDATIQERLEQRYTLAVFYFSMAQASKWPHCRPPETGEVMACVHPVLESYANEGVYYDQKMSEPAFRWLSNADECSWAGIKCRDGMHVSHLQLAGYKLKGSLPIEVGFLRSLEVMDLQQCGLVGTLPVEWGELESDNSALETIRLDRNLLTGTIPKEWCDLNSASLKNLVLSNNELTGEIPTCLSKFVELENFSVMNNELSGTVPEMGTLLHLKTFHVAGNNLSGEFPPSLCNLERYEMKEASADCKNLGSENYVECPCCTTCCDGDDNEDCSLKVEFKDQP